MEHRRQNKALQKSTDEKAHQHKEAQRILEEANQRITQLEEEAEDKKTATRALERKNTVSLFNTNPNPI